MNWQILIEMIVAIGGFEAIKYLINLASNKSKEKAAAQHMAAQAKAKEIENSSKAAEYYTEIKAIIEKETGPIKEELAITNARLKDIQDNWCCYRMACNQRLKYKEETVDDSCAGPDID